MNRILAALQFFTRLPFWRIGEVSADCFKNIVSLWPLTGWLTAGTMVLVLYLSSLILPYSVAILLAIITRLLVTGCLHEDGLADFFDGFGGGRSKERILEIMKDSHIGSYGVIGLICYFLLFFASIQSLPIALAGSAILAGDPYSKGIAAQIINRLPYARTAQEAKNKTVYSKMTAKELIICLCCALLPLLWLESPLYLIAAIIPPLAFIFMIHFIKKRIQGYTGDCCGAIFLLSELSFYIAIAAIYHLSV